MYVYVCVYMTLSKKVCLFCVPSESCHEVFSVFACSFLWEKQVTNPVFQIETQKADTWERPLNLTWSFLFLWLLPQLSSSWCDPVINCHHDMFINKTWKKGWDHSPGSDLSYVFRLVAIAEMYPGSNNTLGYQTSHTVCSYRAPGMWNTFTASQKDVT